MEIAYIGALLLIAFVDDGDDMHSAIQKPVIGYN